MEDNLKLEKKFDKGIQLFLKRINTTAISQKLFLFGFSLYYISKEKGFKNNTLQLALILLKSNVNSRTIDEAIQVIEIKEIMEEIEMKQGNGKII